MTVGFWPPRLHFFVAITMLCVASNNVPKLVQMFPMTGCVLLRINECFSSMYWLLISCCYLRAYLDVTVSGYQPRPQAGG